MNPTDVSHVKVTVENLESRAEWYANGCDGLEDRESYYAGGDLAADAASDLRAACDMIRAGNEMTRTDAIALAIHALGLVHAETDDPDLRRMIEYQLLALSAEEDRLGARGWTWGSDPVTGRITIGAPKA